ncbi:hypothetical protein [Zobellella taiwanensis]
MPVETTLSVAWGSHYPNSRRNWFALLGLGILGGNIFLFYLVCLIFVQWLPVISRIYMANKKQIFSLRNTLFAPSYPDYSLSLSELIRNLDVPAQKVVGNLQKMGPSL